MTQTELQSASNYNNLRCQTILSKCIDAIRLFRGLVKPSTDENWMHDGHPSLGVGQERHQLTPVRTNAGTAAQANPGLGLQGANFSWRLPLAAPSLLRWAHLGFAARIMRTSEPPH